MKKNIFLFFILCFPASTFAAKQSDAIKLLPRHASGKCVDLKKKSTDFGTNVHLWGCNRAVFKVAKNKLWQLENRGNRLIMIRSEKNHGMCIDSTYENRMILKGCHGGGFQTWKLRHKGGNFYSIESSFRKGKCLEVTNGKTEKRTLIRIAKCNGRSYQQFEFRVPNLHKMNGFLKDVVKEVGKAATKVAKAAVKVTAKSIVEAKKAISRFQAKV